MRIALGLMFTAAVAGLAGCQTEHPSVAIGREVAVQSLDAGQHSARFEASVVATGEDTGLDYATALLTAGGTACSPRGLVIQESSPELSEHEVAPPAGKALKMTVACRHDRLPAHRLATQAEAMAMYAKARPGQSARMGSQAMRRGETRLQAAEKLVGGFVREAYTEDCAGKALVVEEIELASVPVDPEADSPYVENMHAVMNFRCVEPATADAQVALAARR